VSWEEGLLWALAGVHWEEGVVVVAKERDRNEPLASLWYVVVHDEGM